MTKQLIRLADGTMLTRKPILSQNIASWCDRYATKHSLQNYCFDVLNEQGELVRQVKFIAGVRQPARGGKRLGSGRKPIYTKTKI